MPTNSAVTRKDIDDVLGVLDIMMTLAIISSGV